MTGCTVLGMAALGRHLLQRAPLVVASALAVDHDRSRHLAWMD